MGESGTGRVWWPAQSMTFHRGPAVLTSLSIARPCRALWKRLFGHDAGGDPARTGAVRPLNSQMAVFPADEITEMRAGVAVETPASPQERKIRRRGSSNRNLCSTSACWPRPIVISTYSFAKGSSERTSTTGLTFLRSSYRRSRALRGYSDAYRTFPGTTRLVQRPAGYGYGVRMPRVAQVSTVAG